MRLHHLASSNNLLLAWRRITTGGNHQYKDLFRDLYVAYEVALEKNLADLRTRLLGGAFEAQRPERIYLPKSSGLHRPLSVLRIEDQIVLQAFANLAAKKLFEKRKPLQLKVVFSNILEHDSSIFFFKRWQATWAAFKRRIRRHYEQRLRWVADFDLAAFYDTVSHELLLKTIYPRAQNADLAWFRDCLGIWSSEKASSSHAHGIPQGPIASDFLAECFLLPIDAGLKKTAGYIRYVDDVRLFGRTEDDVRAAVVQLERRCREHGLIPQSGKFSIKLATSVEDATGMLPSIADPHRPSGDRSTDVPHSHAKLQFKSSLGGKPYRVQDKTRLRYALYRADPDTDMLRLVVRLVPHHPEHVDAFFSYLSTFTARKPIVKLCLALVEKSPYPYVRGKAWGTLSTYLRSAKLIGTRTRKRLVKQALDLARRRRPENFTETVSACSFLCASEATHGQHHSRFLKLQPALVQAMAAPALPDTAFAAGEVAEAFLRSNAFEPGIAVCGRLHALEPNSRVFGIDPAALPSQVRNTLVALGTLSEPGGPVDPIAEILLRRYRLAPGKSWHALLGVEYVHALGVLRQAEAAFDASMSSWLANQNSFHHAVFLALQRHLNVVGHPALCSTVISTGNRAGQLQDFGVMLDANGPFSKASPVIGRCFREMNARRNFLPASHPYDKKTGKRAKHLAARERNAFVGQLRSAYPVLGMLMP